MHLYMVFYVPLHGVVHIYIILVFSFQFHCKSDCHALTMIRLLRILAKRHLGRGRYV